MNNRVGLDMPPPQVVAGCFAEMLRCLRDTVNIVGPGVRPSLRPRCLRVLGAPLPRLVTRTAVGRPGGSGSNVVHCRVGLRQRWLRVARAQDLCYLLFAVRIFAQESAKSPSMVSGENCLLRPDSGSHFNAIARHSCSAKLEINTVCNAFL